MQREQRALGLLNLGGGIAVLASYAWSFSYSSELRAGLWGGVPEAVRPIYTVNMLLAAVGYFPLTWLYLFRTTPGELESATGVRYGLLFLLYGLVLIPSALWLPMTARMLLTPGLLLWWGIRCVLALVGIGSLGLLWLSFRHAQTRPGLASWAATAGAIPFFTQTAILDALLWPAFYPA